MFDSKLFMIEFTEMNMKIITYVNQGLKQIVQWKIQ